MKIFPHVRKLWLLIFLTPLLIVHCRATSEVKVNEDIENPQSELLPLLLNESEIDGSWNLTSH